MGYSLPNVKPHVVAAADEIGPRFGIKTVGGWRARDPYPDHPSGLALDFMIDNIPNGSAVGEALAQYVIANAGRLGVKYIIWNRRSWNAQRKTWVPYTSSTNPHTDHVHVTFNPQGGTGGPIIGTTDTDPVGLGSAASGVLDSFKQFGAAAAWLSNSHNWLRIMYVLIGAALLIGILINLFFQTDIPGLIGDVVSG